MQTCEFSDRYVCMFVSMYVCMEVVYSSNMYPPPHQGN